MDLRERGRASRIVRREGGGVMRLRCDIAVLGAGIAGVSAALEAARLGRKVALIDGAPQLGGQSVASVIGTFCGLYSNGPEPYQVTHGIADGILRDLGAEGALHPIRGRRNTIIVQYREQALARWIERQVAAAGIMPILSALLVSVRREGRRIRGLDLATRFGMLEVEAAGFVDASGDAALAWTAGLPCREPQEPIFGTQILVIEDFDEEALAGIDRAELQARLAAKADRHGLLRHDGFVFATPGKGTALVNMTHAETPLDPVGLARAQAAGREQGDRLLDFLRAEYPAAFDAARVRTYGQIGIRQTRWIVGRHHLTVDEVRQGYRHPDAVGRCSWPIELHDRADGVYWEEFGDGHMHWIPLGAMIPPDIDNLVAAGRCIDGDPAGLSSVRVMGPCIAMGAAAAHALDLAGSGAVAQIDIGRLQARLHDNLERRD
ncbi:MAG: FAD-dependent oxidoreductase [Alphaproteobacteria bacterium]|nr:FAD-dependent oxidoreductase [Alphaproteobacteria bacterium]